MATQIAMKHKTSGIIEDGFYGFSWTTLFFGCFPALFRGDFLTFMGAFVILVILAIATMGVGQFIAMFIWAFLYNSFYTKKMLERGYEFAGTSDENEAAAKALDVSLANKAESSGSADNTRRAATESFAKEDRTLTNDAYKIYLVKNYKIDFNDVLKKYIFNNAIYESVDDALVAVQSIDVGKANQAEMEKEAQQRAYLAKTSPPVGADAVCPNCDKPLRYDDKECWSCESMFTDPKGWRPIRK